MQDETVKIMTYHGKPLITPHELYDFLGGEISIPNIYDLCHREGFPCLHIGKKCWYRFKPRVSGSKHRRTKCPTLKGGNEK